MTDENLSFKAPKTVGRAEVELTDKIFHHIMSNGPILKSRLNSQTASSPNKRSFQRSLAHSAGDENKSLTTIKPYGSSDIPVLSRNRSADHIVKRQMASQCKLHSLHLSSKWGSAETRLLSAYPVGNNIKQREVILEPPSDVRPKRGLSGSKVRKSLQSSKSAGFLTQRNCDASESNSEILSPSSLERSPTTSSKISAPKREVDTEEVNRQLKQLRWNSSDQGLRLQREITYVSSSRFVKRASEVVSYRVDPMYVMSGFKIGLQNRYSIQDGDIKKLQEMSLLRETFNSKLKNLKRRPYSSNPSGNVVRKNPSSVKKTSSPMNKYDDDKNDESDVQQESNLVLNQHPIDNDDEDRKTMDNEHKSLEATHEQVYEDISVLKLEGSEEEDYGKNNEETAALENDANYDEF